MSTQDDVVIRLRLADVMKFVADSKTATMSTEKLEKEILKLGVVSKKESSNYGGLGLWGATVGRMKYAVAGLALATVGAAAGIAKFAVTSIAQYQQVEVAYTNMLGSRSAADAQIKSLQNFANFTPFQFYGDTGIAKMAQQLEAVGIQASRLVGPDGKTGGILGALGDATASIGGSGADMSTAVRDIMTMVTRGKLTGMEVRDLSTHGIMISDYLERQFHLTPAQLEKLISSGQISANTAIQAIVNGVETSKAAGAMKVQSKTLIGLWTTLKDEVTNAAVTFMTPYLPALTTFLSNVVDMFGRADFVSSVTGFFTTIGSFISKLVQIATLPGVERFFTDIASALGWMALNIWPVKALYNWLTAPGTPGLINTALNGIAAFCEDPTVQFFFKNLAQYAVAMWALSAATDASAASFTRLRNVLLFLSGKKLAQGGKVVELTGGAGILAGIAAPAAIVGVAGSLAYRFSSTFRKEWDAIWKQGTSGPLWQAPANWAFAIVDGIAKAIWHDSTDRLWKALSHIGALVRDYFWNWGPSLGDIWNFFSVGPSLSDIGRWLWHIGVVIKDFFVKYFWNWGPSLGDIWGFLSVGPSFSDIGGWIANLGSMLKSMFDDAVNWFIDGLNSVLAVNVMGHNIGPHIDHVGGAPGLAGGGSVTVGGLARIGENGPELLDLPRGASVIPLPRAAEFAGHGSDSRPVVLVADGVQIARVVNKGNDTQAARL